MKDHIVHILGKPYRIKRRLLQELDGNIGSCHRDQQLIFIATDIGKEQYRDTLIHEIIHLINDELDLDFDESTIKRLAVGLISAGITVKVKE